MNGKMIRWIGNKGSKMEVEVKKLKTEVQIILPCLPSHFWLQADSEDSENLEGHWAGTVKRALKSDAAPGSSGQITRVGCVGRRL